MDLRQVPRNDLLLTALQMYKTSDMAKNLKSECNRTVFAEDFETKQAPLLTSLCLKVIAEHYKGRPINLNLTPVQSKIFYDYIDPYLPISSCINIADEYYWNRVYCHMCQDKIAIKKLKMNKNTCWKELVINMKYVEVIESTPVEIWIPDEMHKLSEMVSPYIRQLKISKLQPLRESSFWKCAEPSESEPSEEGLEGLGGEKEKGDEEDAENNDDFAVELCHHVDLSIVKNLSCLHTLIVEFLPPELGMHYHTRFFNFSYMDVQNLASGISGLPNLKSFIIRRSRMDCTKLSTILEAVKAIFVERLEFSYCQLDDECGESIYEYLITTSSLKILNLSGNYFRDSGIEYMAEGIEKSPSTLTHLDVSHNSMLDQPSCRLMEALKACKHLAYLILSGAKVTKLGSICIAKLIKTHHNLEEVELTATPMDGYYLIDAMTGNKNIQQLHCQGCGLTADEEYKVELLLKRNRYIRENPYIGDSSKTEQEINAFVSRIKSPILLKALGCIQSQRDCRKKMEEQANIAQEQFYKRIEGMNEGGSGEINYEADNFTRAELADHITLFGQTNSNFFMESYK